MREVQKTVFGHHGVKNKKINFETVQVWAKFLSNFQDFLLLISKFFGHPMLTPLLLNIPHSWCFVTLNGDGNVSNLFLNHNYKSLFLKS